MDELREELRARLMYLLSISYSTGYEKRSLSFPLHVGQAAELGKLIGAMNKKSDMEMLGLLSFNYPGISLPDVIVIRKLLTAYQDAARTNSSKDEDKYIEELLTFLDELKTRNTKQSTR